MYYVLYNLNERKSMNSVIGLENVTRYGSRKDTVSMDPIVSYISSSMPGLRGKLSMSRYAVGYSARSISTQTACCIDILPLTSNKPHVMKQADCSKRTLSVFLV